MSPVKVEPFSRGTSFIHHSDPRVKIICTALLALIIAFSRDFPAAWAGLLLGVLLTTAARLPWKAVLQRLLIVNSFNLLLWLMLPLTYGQAPFVEFSGFMFSQPGLLLAARITVKANALLLLFISLPATSTIAGLGHGMQELRLSPRLCMLLLFSYRYIFVLEQEYSRLHRAAVLRCFTPKNNLHTYKTYGYLLGMLLVKSWNRALRVQQAMELRGFSGTFHSLHELRMRQSDYLLLTGLLLIGCGILALEVI
jgi:cobalt/nickel transport system permease protein